MKISVVTITFNSGRTVRHTLESVLSQTYKDYEHIIIDGGSKDNTLDIIKELEPRYGGRLRWISEPDKGIYDAMNKGIRMASGDVVGLLNSDDFFSSDVVLENIANEKGGDWDAVYGDVHYVNAKDLDKCVRYYSSKGFAPWKMRMGYIPAHPSFYCKKEIYDKYGTFDTSYKIAGDFDLLLRLIFINRIRLKYIPMDFVTMRTGGASTSGMQSHRQIFKEHMRAYRENGVKSNFLLESVRYICKGTSLAFKKLLGFNPHRK